MIFFDIDDTLLNFRDAELNGVKEIYDKGGFYCKDNFNNFIFLSHLLRKNLLLTITILCNISSHFRWI